MIRHPQSGPGSPGAETIRTSLGSVSLDRVGDGPDVVLLHSLLTDRHVFDDVAPVLAASRRVNLLDLPGFGRTERVAPDIDAYADLVGAMLREGGFDPATTALLGNGLGAFIALATAVRHGQAFDRLVLVGCGVGFDEESRAGFERMAALAEEGGMEAVAPTAVNRIFSTSYLEEHPEIGEERRRVLLRTDPAAFAAACRALAALDLTPHASQVANPTLVVVGTEDTATPPHLARDLAAALPSSRLAELPGVAHAPQLQAPAELMAAIGPFLGLAVGT